VERIEAADGRERPWRATHVGLNFGEFGDDPATRAAQLGILGASMANDQLLTQRFADSIDQLSPEWRNSAGLNDYALRISASELETLNAAIDALVRPYVATIRDDAPPDARPVHATWRAIPRIEADGKP
jgi:hypothetical protein